MEALEKKQAEELEAKRKAESEASEIARRAQELDNFIQEQILKYGPGNSERANKEAARRDMIWDVKEGRYIKDPEKIVDDDLGYLYF